MMKLAFAIDDDDEKRRRHARLVGL